MRRLESWARGYGLEKNAAYDAAVGAQGSSIDRGSALAGDERDQVGHFLGSDGPLEKRARAASSKNHRSTSSAEIFC